jgi:hypothetical protein
MARAYRELLVFLLLFLASFMLTPLVRKLYKIHLIPLFWQIHMFLKHKYTRVPQAHVQVPKGSLKHMCDKCYH